MFKNFRAQLQFTIIAGVDISNKLIFYSPGLLSGGEQWLISSPGFPFATSVPRVRMREKKMQYAGYNTKTEWDATPQELVEYFIICNISRRQVFDEWGQLNMNNLVNGDIRCNWYALPG